VTIDGSNVYDDYYLAFLGIVHKKVLKVIRRLKRPFENLQETLSNFENQQMIYLEFGEF
jgi:hypothetical protein